MLAAVANDTDLEYLMLDGSTVRVHQHGAAKKIATGRYPNIRKLTRQFF
jgi:hypothetical protein